MKTSTRKLLYVAVSILIIGVTLIAGCAAPTAEVIEVEKVVTQVITEKVIETVVVEGTAQIVEKEVETIIEVTATPEPIAGVMKPVPRNRTVVVGAWEHQSQLIGTDNFNPLINVASLRTNSAKFIYEALMYNNLNTGEYYPWLAESFELDDDYMGMDIYLRKGVEWADGEALNCDDVKYSIDIVGLTDNARWKGLFNEWIESVECVDDFTVRVNYTKTNPRFHFRLMVGWENHFVIVPEHIFVDKDFGTFTNLDLGKGWPMGSGPYKLILVTPNQIIYDRRDDWWGAKIGFQDMPIPERIVSTNAASDEAYAQLYMTDKLDYGGFALQIGSFEAAKEKNPNVRSWYNEGPIYGAADGCMYRLRINNSRFDRDMRLALNYAMDRQEVVDLAYQGATIPKEYPISNYIMGAWGDILQPVFDKYNRNAPSQDKVDEHMEAAGYEKNGDGFWAKDGEVLEITVHTPQPWAPIGPVVGEQFIEAGFKTEEFMDTANQWQAALAAGEFDIIPLVLCGSIYDPYDSLNWFHSKNSGVGSYSDMYPGDPRMDELIELMEATPPDTGNAAYVEWAKEAMDIFLRDMPTLIISEELHVITMNETYWTGWPNENDPYIAPYPCWNDFTLAIFHVQPTQ